MSFYNSLEQLKIKLKQKNIILITGNVDELFINKFSKSENNLEKTKLVSLKDFVIQNLKDEEYKNISYYHPSKGTIYYGEEDSTEQEVDEFDDEDLTEDSSNLIPIQQFISDISKSSNAENKIVKIDKEAYLIDFAELFFDKAGTGANVMNIAELLTNFINIEKNSDDKLIWSQRKLILFSKLPDVINASFQSNNIEFANVVIQKPDADERKDFFNSFARKFEIKETINDPESEDFKDAITISDDLSFREILQYAKISDYKTEDLTFKQLYNLATFNKQDSEWEKIDYSKFKNIKSILSKRVKGQEFAVDSVISTLKRVLTGLNGISHSSISKKPKGILFFVGPTGVGKTELAKSLAEFIFGDENRIIRFDMSEYNHEHSDQKLIGSPPGYVGFDAGGQLTNAVKQKPFSILLFDEIEKAHGKIFDKFLQILEDGRLTSSQGEIIDFSETFIIFTSNIGTSKIKNSKSEKEDRQEFYSAVTNHFRDELQRVEILNRIGKKNIIPFNFITDDSIIDSILESKLDKIIQNLKNNLFIRLKLSDKNKLQLNELMKKNFDHSLGGRGIVAEIETVLIDKLSEWSFENLELINKNKLNKAFTDVELKIDSSKLIFELK